MTAGASCEDDSESQMLEIRKAFETVFKLVAACVMLLVVVTGAAIVFVAFKTHMQLSEKLLIARFIQVSFGMTIGSGCVFFGVILVWLGIAASTHVTAVSESVASKGSLQVATSSPGVIIALAGIVLIALSLYRPIGYTETQIDEPKLVEKEGSKGAP